MTWDAKVTAFLCSRKQAGYTDHELAWLEAMAKYPPRPSDMAASNGTLFDVATGEVEVSLVDAMHDFTADAWYGRKPGLRSFTMDLLAPPDETRSALIAGHVRAAA